MRHWKLSFQVEHENERRFKSRQRNLKSCRENGNFAIFRIPGSVGWYQRTNYRSIGLVSQIQGDRELEEATTNDNKRQPCGKKKATKNPCPDKNRKNGLYLDARRFSHFSTGFSTIRKFSGILFQFVRICFNFTSQNTIEPKS